MPDFRKIIRRAFEEKFKPDSNFFVLSIHEEHAEITLPIPQNPKWFMKLDQVAKLTLTLLIKYSKTKKYPHTNDVDYDASYVRMDWSYKGQRCDLETILDQGVLSDQTLDLILFNLDLFRGATMKYHDLLRVLDFEKSAN